MLIVASVVFILSTLHGNHDKANGSRYASPKQAADEVLMRPDTEIKFSKRGIDFGKVPDDTILKANFTIYNVGPSYLKIKAVLPDCSCTNFLLAKDSVASNDSTVLTLIYETKNKIGKQNLHTVVEMNTREKLYMLSLQADVFEKQ